MIIKNCFIFCSRWVHVLFVLINRYREYITQLRLFSKISKKFSIGGRTWITKNILLGGGGGVRFSVPSTLSKNKIALILKRVVLQWRFFLNYFYILKTSLTNVFWVLTNTQIRGFYIKEIKTAGFSLQNQKTCLINRERRFLIFNIQKRSFLQFLLRVLLYFPLS